MNCGDSPTQLLPAALEPCVPSLHPLGREGGFGILSPLQEGDFE